MFGRSRNKTLEPPAKSPPVSESRNGSRPSTAAPSEEIKGQSESKSQQDQAARRRAAIAVRHSLAFAQIVSILMRSERHKRYPIAALEWLALPPLLTGQFCLAEATTKQKGVAVPVAVALWARVSPEIDKRLGEDLDKPIRLRPTEWRSGDILWLIEAVGDRRAMPQFLKHLGTTTFKGRAVKMRSRGPDGKLSVRSLLGPAS